MKKPVFQMVFLIAMTCISGCFNAVVVNQDFCENNSSVIACFGGEVIWDQSINTCRCLCDDGKWGNHCQYEKEACRGEIDIRDNGISFCNCENLPICGSDFIFLFRNKYCDCTSSIDEDFQNSSTNNKFANNSKSSLSLESDYFPLIIGNLWKYSVLDIQGTSISEWSMELNDRFSIDSKKFYGLDVVIPDSSGSQNASLGILLTNPIDDPNQVQIYFNEDQSSFLSFHKFPSPGNYTFNESQVTIEDAGTVTVPAGSYDNCMRIIDQETSNIFTYAPGVGLIKVISEGIENMVLTQFNRGCTLNIIGNLNHNNCGESNSGNIDLQIEGATENIAFNWSGPVEIGNIPNPSMLPSGLYSVTITNNNCNIEMTLIEIKSENSELNLEADIRQPNCNSESGSIDITLSDTENNYSFEWNNGAYTTEDLVNVIAGNYTLIVTDQNGCTITRSFVVEEYNEIDIDEVTIEDVSEENASDGSISLSISGGSGTYTYRWNNGEYSTRDISNLRPGIYTLLVTDSEGCTTSKSFTISTAQSTGVPSTLSIQGVLQNRDGEILEDGFYDLSFRIYFSPDDILALWREDHLDVDVRSGIFSVILGSVNTLDLPFDSPYTLGISVDGGVEMLPRIELTSTAYSLMAKSVEDNAITPEKIEPDIISRINGVSNDGGNVDIVAGANVMITSDDDQNRITISAVDPGGSSSGILQINAGSGIEVQDGTGPTVTISATETGTGKIQSISEGNAINVVNPNGPDAVISVQNNSINDDEIQNNSLTELSLAPGSVGTSELQSNSVGSSEMQDNSIGSSELQTNSVGSSEIQANAVGTSEIENNAVTTNKILPNIISSLDGVSNDGGNINLIAGANVSIVPDDINNTITISANGGNGGGGTFGPNVLLSPDGSLSIANNQGTIISHQSANPLGGGLFNLYNPLGTIAAQITEVDGYGTISIANPTGRPIASMHNTQLGAGWFTIWGNEGNVLAQMTEDGIGNGFLGISNQNEAPIVSIYGTNQGSGFLQINNTEGTKMASLSSSTANNSGEFKLFDQLGTDIVSLSANSVFNTGELRLKDQNGAEKVHLWATPESGFLELKGGGELLIWNKTPKVVGSFRTSETNRQGVIEIHSTEDASKNIIEIKGNDVGDGEINTYGERGNQYVSLNSSEGGGSVDVFDRNGNIVGGVSADVFGGAMGVADIAGNEAAIMRIGEDGVEAFITNDEQKEVASIRVNNQKGGRFAVRNSSNVEQARMTTVTDGGYISVDAKNGNDIARLGVNTSGGGVVVIDNPDDVSVAQLNSLNGHGYISIDNSSNQEIVRMRGDDNGNGDLDIRNSQGVIVSTVSTSTSGGGYIGIDNVNDTRVGQLTTNENFGGSFSLNNATRVEVVKATTLSSGGGYFSLSHGGGAEIVRLSNSSDRGSISTLDTQGDVLTSMTSASNGDGLISVRNSTGNSRAFITTNTSGGGFMRINDNSGNERTRLTTLSSSAGSVQTFGANGSLNFAATTTSNSSRGQMNVYDENGRRRAGWTGSGGGGTEGPNGNLNVQIGFLLANTNHGYLSVHDSGGNDRAGMYINTSGQGEIYADIKHFRMEDEEDKSKEIWYASLEGPEAGAYTRGTSKLINGEATIVLPDHFTKVAVDDGMTVHLTPLSAESEGLAVVKKTCKQIVVKELRKGKGNYQFDFIVHAVRSGYEHYEVVRDKVFIKGSGYHADQSIISKEVKATMIKNKELIRDDLKSNNDELNSNLDIENHE